jgi:hypothetical protein
MQINPRGLRISVRKQIFGGYSLVFKNQLTGLQVPPDIAINQCVAPEEEDNR